MLTNLPSGKILVVHGANGSGKTTYLKKVAGILKTDTLFTHQEKPIEAHTLHYWGHRLGFRETCTVFQALFYDPSMIGLPFTLSESLQNMAHRTLNTLSQGERCRVALERLRLQKHKPLWILDEPESHLDDLRQKELEQLLISHADMGNTVILATHQPERWQHPLSLFQCLPS